MLQPRQLKRVEARHGMRIAALREFLVSAEVPLNNAATLALLSGRMASDCAFRRDLRSSLWLAAHSSKGSLEATELVGMLALAAVGPLLASQAGDAEAHQLLLLATETCALTSLPAKTANTRKAPSRWLIAACLVLAAVPLPVVFVRYKAEHRTEQPSAASPKSAHENVRVAPVTDPEAAYPVPAPQAVLPARRSAFSTAVPPVRAFEPRSSVPIQPSLARPLETVTAGRESGSVAVRESLTPPSTAGTSANGAAAAPAAATKPSAQRVIDLTVPIPSSVLSKRLDARSLPPEYANDQPRTYPRLLRRRPLLPLAAEASDTTALLAANEAATVNLAGVNATRSSPGTVRPVSLGMMAANVLYSPAPAYPPAAAAAHVQGQVTVQAEVDRDGNVAAARVVSGPPLLRDAAVDAVQRWRYRPYRAAGKAVSASATAVVEFELP